MISVKCIKCGKELDKQGGLLFSPPNTETSPNLVEKRHLCVDCYWLIIQELEK